MFAGAAFTDSADIKSTEAVNMLSALGVINGYTDGSFKPNDTVTRAEMAKMIFVLRTGSDKATAYENATTKFTDIKGHWAAPYIKYCEAMGIIAGKSATKFDPDATVTGEETAKMLLVTIGYDASKAGLVGTAWAQKSTALATENGLLEDVDASLGLALPRQWAAQMIYNAVDADTVSYNADGQVVKTEKTENSTVPYVSSTTKKYDAVKDNKVIATFDSYTDAKAAIDAAQSGDELYQATIKARSEDVYTYVQETKTKNETVGEKYLDLHTTTGVLMVAGNTTLNASLSAGDDLLKVVFVDTDVDEGSKTSFTKVKTDYTDLLGQRVKVLYKETDKVIGVYADNDNTVVAGVASDLDTVSNEVKVKINGTKYSFDDTFALYQDNAKVNSACKAADVKAYVDAVSDSDFEMKAIDLDGNGKIDTIRVITKTFGKMSSVSASTVYVKNIVAGNTVSTKKFDIEDDEPEMYDGIKKDDYVFVGVNQFTGNPTIVKATEVTGKASALKDDKVQIDGKWYKLKNANKHYNNLDIDKQYTLQVFGAYAYDVDGANASDIDTLLVKTVGDKKTLDKGVEAKVLFEDGTEKVINVVKVGSTDNSNLDTLKGKLSAGLYEYDEDDGDYTLKAISGTTGDYTNIDGEKTDFTAVALTDGTNKANGFDKDESTIEGKDVADDAVIFMMYKNSSNEDKYKVISGKTLMSYSDIQGTGVSGVALYDTSDKDKVKVAYIAKTGTISSGDSLYGMVTGVQYKKNADGDKVAYVSVLNNAVTEEVTVKTDKSSVSFKKGDIVEITGSWTVATDINKLTVTGDTQGYGAIKTYNESTKRVSFETIATSGTTKTLQSAKVTGDTTVLFVDMSGDDPKAVASGSYDEAIELLSDAGALYGYKANAFAKIDATDSEFDLLVVEVNNEFKDSGCKNVIELYTTADGDVSGKTYTVAGQVAKDITDSTATTKTFTVTPSTTSAKWGEKVTMTVKLAEKVPTDRKVTVQVSAPTGVSDIVLKAGETTATFDVVVKDNITVTATATEAAQ